MRLLSLYIFYFLHTHTPTHNTHTLVYYLLSAQIVLNDVCMQLENQQPTNISIVI